MRNTVFFAGIPENELSGHSRNILEQEFRGQEVKFVPETNPKEFVRKHSYVDESTRKPSVAGFSVRVVGEIPDQEKVLWNKLSANSNIDLLFAEVALFDKIDDTQIIGWAHSGQVPAAEPAADDFADLFGPEEDDEPKQEVESTDPADKLIEEHDTPVDTSNLGSSPFARPSVEAVIPPDLQEEMNSVLKKDDEDEIDHRPVNRINEPVQDTHRFEEPRPETRREIRQNSSNGPVLPPIVSQHQPVSEPQDDPRSFKEEEAPAPYVDNEPTQSNQRVEPPVQPEPAYREPVREEPIYRQPVQEPPVQNYSQQERYREPEPRQQYRQEPEQYRQPEREPDYRGQHQQDHYGNDGYRNPQQGMHPDQMRASNQFNNPIHQYDEGFNEQPLRNDRPLDEELLSGNGQGYYPNNNRVNGHGSDGFPELNHEADANAPYLARLEPEERRSQVNHLSRFEMNNGPVQRLSQYESHLPKNKVVMITSTRGGSGKTTLSYIMANGLCMGLTQAEDDRLVWLVEADYENPKLEERFNSRNNNISVIARAIMNNQGNGRHSTAQVIRNAIDRASIRPEGAPNNLRVIPALYDFSDNRNGEEAIPAKWITYAITETIKFIRDNLGGYVVIDNGTLTGKQFNPLHNSLINLSNKTIVVAWPENIEDALRSANVVTESGTPTADTKIFLNKIDNMDQFYRVQDQMVPYEVAGQWPIVNEIDKMWIGSPGVSDEARTALLVRSFALYKQIGFEHEINRIAQQYEHVSDGDKKTGIRSWLRNISKKVSK